MKLIPIILLTFVVLLPEYVVAQTEAAETPMDTLVFVSNRRALGKVQRVTTSIITFIPKGKNTIQEFQRRQIHRILYANGRSEFFNTLAVEMVDENSWKTVILSENAEDVQGLYELGKIDAQSSPQSRSSRAARNSAEIRLRKRAVNMGGIIVLITRRESKGGFNEIPTHFVEGIVYGYELPQPQ